MDEAHELRKKISRCRRSLLVMAHPAPIATLEAMIKAAESRLAEIEPHDELSEPELADR